MATTRVKKRTPKLTVLFVRRVPEELIRRLDRQVEREKKLRPHRRVARNEIVCELLEQALAQKEKGK